MQSLTLSQAETGLLVTLLTHDTITIVWDINAFYFITSGATYKLECISEAPAGSDSPYDEVFSCRFFQEIIPFEFVPDSPSYWYKVLHPSTTIQAITVVETTQAFPSGTFLADSTETTETVTTLCLGLLLSTAHGIIPALLQPDRFGFDWLDKYDFYSPEEINSILEKDFATCNFKQLPPLPPLI